MFDGAVAVGHSAHDDQEVHEFSHYLDVGDGDASDRVGGGAKFVPDVVRPWDVPHKRFERLGAAEEVCSLIHQA